MTCWVVIPTKAPPEAKGRLSGALNADSRAALAQAMLARAIAAARQAEGVDGVALVGTIVGALPEGVELLPEPQGGLNGAVTSARAVLAARGASRIVTLAADLPLVSPEDVAALCAMPAGVAAIAPDRHGTGTNALSLPLPDGLGLTYSYGIGSCALHRAEAEHLGLELRDVTTPGLARDIDEPADLADAASLIPAQEA